MGAGHRLDLTVDDFWRLQRRLPDARFVNAGQLLWRLRAVKSPAEIAQLRRASLAVLEDEALLAHVNTNGRIGHGTGLDLGEPPSLQLGETTPLEAGMVLYVEPNCLTAEGNFMVEEMVLLGPDGPELLSMPAPDEMPVLAD